MHHWLVGFVFVFGACTAPRPEDGPLTSFEFLEGTWAVEKPSGITEESWELNHGWSLRGLGRTLQEGRTVFVEKLSIEPRGHGFVYVAELPGAQPVEFTMVARGHHYVRFENPAHDFPRLIEYRRDGDLLRAHLVGVENGKTRQLSFDYRRVAR